MKQKTIFILYCIGMILLIPLVIDSFANEHQYGSGLILLFLMAFGTWGLIKLRKK